MMGSGRGIFGRRVGGGEDGRGTGEGGGRDRGSTSELRQED